MLWIFTIFFVIFSCWLLFLLYKTFHRLDNEERCSRFWMQTWQDCDEELHQQRQKEYALRRTFRHEMQMTLDGHRATVLAMEQGNFELADSYEQEFLSFKEKIGSLMQGAEADRRDIRRLIRIVARHDEKCLPSLDFRLSGDVQELLDNWRTYSDPSLDE